MMDQARSCWDPILHGPKGFLCPKTSPEAHAPAPPWLCVHSKEKPSFGIEPQPGIQRLLLQQEQPGVHHPQQCFGIRFAAPSPS